MKRRRHVRSAHNDTRHDPPGGCARCVRSHIPGFGLAPTIHPFAPTGNINALVSRF